MFANLLSIPQAVLLGIIEGITEFLPISSTGHLLIVGDLINFGTGASKIAGDTYSVAIQFGAILAVLVLYRSRIFSMMRGVAGADADGRATLLSLFAAFIPAAVIGVVAGDAIKSALFGPIPVTIAWALGGLLLVRWVPKAGHLGVHQLTTKTAFLIGLAQGIALWPGVSRSLVTLIAGLAVGLSLSAAIEFSFLLGLVTLSAATALDLLKHGGELVDTFGIATPLIGLVCAFITALIAVRWMVSYLNTKSLAIFGWYRMGVAALCGVLLLANIL